MALQSGRGYEAAPQAFVRLTGSHLAKPRASRDHITVRKAQSEEIAALLDVLAALGVGPHGMIGTVEVEFFGDPSISLSE